MRYLGIDYGSKRVGIAISDEGGRMAFPKKVIPTDKKLIQTVVKICLDQNVGAVVVGESKNLAGGDNLITPKIQKFVEALKKEIKVPIYMEPEFFTSAEAERIQGKNDMIDASAAAIILKSFLDKQNNL